MKSSCSIVSVKASFNGERRPAWSDDSEDVITLYEESQQHDFLYVPREIIFSQSQLSICPLGMYPPVYFPNSRIWTMCEWEATQQHNSIT